MEHSYAEFPVSCHTVAVLLPYRVGCIVHRLVPLVFVYLSKWPLDADVRVSSSAYKRKFVGIEPLGKKISFPLLLGDEECVLTKDLNFSF